MRKMIFLTALVVGLIFLMLGIYIKFDHHVKVFPIMEFEKKGIDDYYDFIFTDKELSEYEEEMGISIKLPEEFNFEKEAILICGGHSYIDGYYNILDEDDKFSSLHHLYVVMNKEKEDKVYLYTISNTYRSWFYSQRYCDDFNGIEYSER